MDGCRVTNDAVEAVHPAEKHKQVVCFSYTTRRGREKWVSPAPSFLFFTRNLAALSQRLTVASGGALNPQLSDKLTVKAEASIMTSYKRGPTPPL